MTSPRTLALFPKFASLTKSSEYPRINHKVFSRVAMKNEQLLDSWKAISNFLDRNVRTCHRWETKLGLPVHRIDDRSPRSKVFAYRSEIEQWLRSKTNNKKVEKKAFFENKWAIIGSISGLVLIAVIFALLYFTQINPFSSSPDSLSIAVLPFKNHDVSGYEEYLSEGMTQVIINNLTRQNNLKVVPWISVFQFKDEAQNTQQIQEKLGVDYVVKGNFRKRDNKINLTTQLVRTKDDKTIMNDNCHGRLEDIFSFQKDICSQIAKKLNLNTGQNLPNQLNEGKIPDPRAYDSYLKANYILSKLNDEEESDPWELNDRGKHYSKMGTQESNEIAIDFFRRAIKLDSSFAPAYLGLAHCYMNNVNFGWDSDIQWVNKAEDLIQQAQTMQPDLPEYYTELITVYLIKDIVFAENTRQMAFDLAEEGIQKYYNNAKLNSIVGYCYYLKFGEKGKQTDFNKALEYKEKNFWQSTFDLNNIAYTELLMLNREFHKAIKICNNLKQADKALMSTFRLGEIYYYMGDLEKSRAIFQQFDSRVKYKSASLLNLGMIASQKGEIEEAQKIIREISILSPIENKLSLDHLKLASIYFGLGMKETGYKYLKSFFNMDGIKKIPFVLHRYIEIDRNFDIYKEEEEFQKIIRGENRWQEARRSE